MKIGFIGTGHMGGALAKAASQNGSNTLLLANRHPEKAQKLAEIIGGTPCDNLQAASEADYLFLGVKPQMLEGMLIGIEDTLKARKTPFVIVSMVAGRSIAQLQEMLGFNAPIIRIMPNTPVSVGAGMILYCCSSEVSPEAEDGFLSAMTFAGRFVRIEERLAKAPWFPGAARPLPLSFWRHWQTAVLPAACRGIRRWKYLHRCCSALPKWLWNPVPIPAR